MPSYCSEADVQAATSRWANYTTPAGARVDQAIINASKMVDQQTNKWFDNRHLLVKTQPCVPNQTKLFMPANIISLDSVTETGVALNVSTQVLAYSTWIEKVYTSAPSNLFNSCWPAWVPGQQNISVQGHFGYSAVPQDIVQATAHIAGMILGMVERQYTTGDGAAGAALVLKLPAWVKTILINNTLGGIHTQPFVLSVVP